MFVYKGMAEKSHSMSIMKQPYLNEDICSSGNFEYSVLARSEGFCVKVWICLSIMLKADSSTIRIDQSPEMLQQLKCSLVFKLSLKKKLY